MRGHSKHTLPVPLREVGAHTDNPSTEKLLTPAHLQLHGAVADKANAGDGEACQGRETNQALCLHGQGQLRGAASTAQCLQPLPWLLLPRRFLSPVQMTAAVPRAAFLLPAPDELRVPPQFFPHPRTSSTAALTQPGSSSTTQPSEIRPIPASIQSLPKLSFCPQSSRELGAQNPSLPRGQPSRGCTSALLPGPSCPFPALQLHSPASDDFQMQKHKAPRTGGLVPFPPQLRVKSCPLPAASQQPPFLAHAHGCPVGTSRP